MGPVHGGGVTHICVRFAQNCIFHPSIGVGVHEIFQVSLDEIFRKKKKVPARIFSRIVPEFARILPEVITLAKVWGNRDTPLPHPPYSLKKSLHSLYFDSLGSDVSDHFFWSEYRVNRTRFHQLSSEFSLYHMSQKKLQSDFPHG